MPAAPSSPPTARPSRAGIDPDDLTAVLPRLDTEQEDEPRRGRLVETVFHPMPLLERRVAALAAERGPELPQPWNTARTALCLSWASLGLLPAQSIAAAVGLRSGSCFPTTEEAHGRLD